MNVLKTVVVAVAFSAGAAFAQAPVAAVVKAPEIAVNKVADHKATASKPSTATTVNAPVKQNVKTAKPVEKVKAAGVTQPKVVKVKAQTSAKPSATKQAPAVKQ